MSQSHAHDHGHDHDHDHTPTVTSANERKVLVSFFLIFGFMLVEAVGGVLSGSLALLADAGHMLTDAWHLPWLTLPSDSVAAQPTANAHSVTCASRSSPAS